MTDLTKMAERVEAATTCGLRIARAFLCFHVVGLIGFVAHYFPRTKTKARVVNALTAPFFGPAGWWALSRNPSFRAAQECARANQEHQ